MDIHLNVTYELRAEVRTKYKCRLYLCEMLRDMYSIQFLAFSNSSSHITIVFRQIISFTEATVFCLYTKLSKHDSCTQFYLINSYLHSYFTFNILKKFVLCIGAYSTHNKLFQDTESEVTV